MVGLALPLSSLVPLPADARESLRESDAAPAQRRLPTAPWVWCLVAMLRSMAALMPVMRSMMMPVTMVESVIMPSEVLALCYYRARTPSAAAHSLGSHALTAHSAALWLASAVAFRLVRSWIRDAFGGRATRDRSELRWSRRCDDGGVR